jgi:hypothetical protein
VVEPGQPALAESCDDDNQHPSKAIDVALDVWDDTPESQYMLILQIPPTVGTLFEVKLESELLSKTVERSGGGG